MILFYNLFLVVYTAGIRLVSIWNKKARLWLKGRKNYFEDLKRDFDPNNENTIWMHCASLGEFEQGRPILIKIKSDYPEANIIITFFSPSGYTIALKDKDFKKVFYLPMDSSTNAKKLLDILKPTLVLWVKYEYWYYHLSEIKRRNIPLLLISGIFRNDQVFFKWYGSLYRKMLQSFTHFFIQNASSKSQLQTLISEEKITLSGDTRCDR
ncbi:MAG: 3-deoxy-D-manno-octulosonic acid transferase, partial [Bacteroidota bacterium]|nr:3-deoxy-D-manno-octulosonic acid transferase [Bacteroidota bacterium]